MEDVRDTYTAGVGAAVGSARAAGVLVLALGEAEEVELADEVGVGAGLVGGTEDIGEQTAGQQVVEDTVTLHVRLVDTAGDLAAGALSLGLRDAGRATSVRLGNGTGDEESRGEREDTSELHFEGWVGKKIKNLNKVLFESGR